MHWPQSKINQISILLFCKQLCRPNLRQPKSGILLNCVAIYNVKLVVSQCVMMNICHYVISCAFQLDYCDYLLYCHFVCLCVPHLVNQHTDNLFSLWAASIDKHIASLAAHHCAFSS